VDCRTAHQLMRADMPPDKDGDYAAHLRTCAACRDDVADPLSRALVQTTIEMALPPPDFTGKLLSRLPSESPLELEQQAAQRQRRQWIILGLITIGLVGGLTAIGIASQPVWSNTTLGLIAGVLRDLTAAAVVPLVVMVAGAIVIAFLLQGVLREPTVWRSLGAGGLALGLLVTTALTTTLNEQAAASTGAATIAAPINAASDVRGNLFSIAGDISVAGAVEGNVASLLGSVTLQPGASVGGDVLAGTGQLTNNDAQISGTLHAGAGSTALGQALVGAGADVASPGAVRSLAAMLGALITLALSALVVMLWPQRTLRTSRVLPTHPWAALGLGVLVTALLALLALPLLALLALTVVGLLLVPMLLMAVHVPYVQGLAAVVQALGRRLTGAATITSALWGVAVQLLVVIGLGLFSPLAGLTAFYLLASIGLGAQLLGRRMQV
jgi:hypothetical protein